MSALVANAAVVLSCLTLAVHAGPDAVGVSTLAPTTIYYSQHRDQSSEEHLHAETGIESYLCLACLLSLRNRALAHSPSTAVVASGSRAAGPSDPSRYPFTTPGKNFSSRAPPRA